MRLTSVSPLHAISPSLHFSKKLPPAAISFKVKNLPSVGNQKGLAYTFALGDITNLVNQNHWESALKETEKQLAATANLEIRDNDDLLYLCALNKIARYIQIHCAHLEDLKPRAKAMSRQTLQKLPNPEKRQAILLGLVQKGWHAIKYCLPNGNH